MNKEKKTDYKSILFIVAVPIVFYNLGFWIGLITLIVGLVALGWKDRYKKVKWREE